MSKTAKDYAIFSFATAAITGWAAFDNFNGGVSASAFSGPFTQP
jgi:hypothetical protein